MTNADNRDVECVPMYVAICAIILFWPLGIIVVIYCIINQKMLEKQDIYEAEKAFEKAKRYSIWASILGILLLLYYIHGEGMQQHEQHTNFTEHSRQRQEQQISPTHKKMIHMLTSIEKVEVEFFED